MRRTAAFLFVCALTLPGLAHAAADTASLEQVTRDQLGPGAVLIALGALALSLLLALRRERLPAPVRERPDASAGEPRLPESLREVRLFRLRYGVSFVHGRLEPSGRSGRRLTLRAPGGLAVAWSPPDGAFHPALDRPLSVLAAGGRAIASCDPTTGRVALHEADLARLHGLGRRGRGLILWPLVLATAAFAALADRVLGGFLVRGAGLSPRELRLPLAVTAAFFALGALAALGTSLSIASAVLRRVRRAQLRRRYEGELRAFLGAFPGQAGAATTTD